MTSLFGSGAASGGLWRGSHLSLASPLLHFPALENAPGAMKSQAEPAGGRRGGMGVMVGCPHCILGKALLGFWEARGMVGRDTGKNERGDRDGGEGKGERRERHTGVQESHRD